MIVTLYPVLACIVHCKDVCVHQMKLMSILLMILDIQSSITRYKQHEEVCHITTHLNTCIQYMLLTNLKLSDCIKTGWTIIKLAGRLQNSWACSEWVRLHVQFWHAHSSCTTCGESGHPRLRYTHSLRWKSGYKAVRQFKTGWVGHWSCVHMMYC